MPPSPAVPHLSRLPVHPHQIEVQEFDSYALIVDLRDAADYAHDHVPGAVNIPRQGSTALTTGGDAVASLVVEEAGGLPYALEAQLERLEPRDAVLVYGATGDVASAAVARRLRERGIDTDVLHGGWDTYRRWVTAGVALLPRVLSLVWVRSAPGGAAQAVLAALEERGAQVVSLASILGQRRWPGLSLPGDPGLAGMSQDAFDTALVDAMRRLDPGRDVWVDECLFLDERVAFDATMRLELVHAPALQIDVPLEDRIRALQRKLKEQGTDVGAAIDALRGVVPASYGTVLEAARVRAVGGESAQALELVLTGCTDPLYEATRAPTALEAPARLTVPSLDPDAIRLALQALPDPWPARLRPDPDQSSP